MALPEEKAFCLITETVPLSFSTLVFCSGLEILLPRFGGMRSG